MAASTFPMPQYRCNKLVWALKIQEVIGQASDPLMSGHPTATITFEDEGFAPVHVDILGKTPPVAGMYFVRNVDGQISFAPTGAFEGDYTRSSE
jgi:hypothetical protein